MLFAISVSILMITSVYGCGKVTGGGQIQIGDGKASFGFNAMEFTKDDGPKGELEYLDHTIGLKVHAHVIEYLGVWEDNLGNKPWPERKARFFGPCTVNGVGVYTFEVIVHDDGEPKSPDFFRIGVWAGTEVGVESNALYWSEGLLLTGNIQIHKPPK